MKAVILAGGLGSRLRPFTEIIPKPLLPVGEQSLMEVQIQALRRSGVDTVFVATNYKSELVQAYLGDGSKYGLKLIFSQEDKPLGTCGPLSLLKRQLVEPFLMMNGDVLTTLDFSRLVAFGCEQQSFLTIATKVITTPFRFGNVEVDARDHVISVEEKPQLSFEVLAGIYFMRPEVLKFVPDNAYYGMDLLIKDMLAVRAPISRYLIHDYWLDIGQVDDYSTARQEFSKHFDEPKARS